MKERQRLFNLPRSSWQDFDKSEDFGGWRRVLALAEVDHPVEGSCKAIGLAKTTATPFEIMTAILKAPVDLLWFGGIGTYVRSSLESDAEVGDRANDSIRITGSDVRAKSSAKAPISASHRRRASSSACSADAAIPMRSTIRPASTRPTSRSISRSPWHRPCALANCSVTSATRCLN